MIEGAERRGALRPGMRVVEYTGGSTGSSLAMVCAMKGYEFHPLSSDAFAAEKLDTMRAFGADLELIPSDGGKVTPALFDRFKARIRELAQDPNTFWTDQFNNADAIEGYANIGRELVEQAGTVDAFVGMVGTAGMLVGVSRALEAGGRRRAHHRARTVHLAVPHDGQRRRASRRGHGRGLLAAAPGRRIVRRGACHRRERRPCDGAPGGEGRRHLRRHVHGPEPGGRARLWRASSARAKLWPRSRSTPGSNTSPAISTNRVCRDEKTPGFWDSDTAANRIHGLPEQDVPF